MRGTSKNTHLECKHHHLSGEDKRISQPGFFNLDERYAKLNERDLLVKLNQIAD